jgi:hypothetical protein
MTPARRAVIALTFGAWLLKANPRVSAVDGLVRSGFGPVTGWCVRPSYRTELVERGQPVLFWVSGGDPVHPTGIYAQGRTRGRPRPEPGGTTLVLPLHLDPLPEPVLRTDLLEHPLLAGLEVLRMAAGSNPSFLDREQLAELRRQWPHVTAG